MATARNNNNDNSIISSHSISNSYEAFQTPANLQSRCMRLYGWTEGFAKRAVTGYRQFMGLKVLYKDWDATVLAPPLMIEKVWQQHILDVHRYAEACDEFCGRVVHHNPDDDAEEEEDGGGGGFGNNNNNGHVMRIRTTMRAARTVHRLTLDPDIWSFSQTAAAAAAAAENDSEEEEENDSDDDDDDDDGEEEKEDRKPQAYSSSATTWSPAASSNNNNNNRRRRRTGEEDDRTAVSNDSRSRSSKRPRTTARPAAAPVAAAAAAPTRSDPLTIFVRRYIDADGRPPQAQQAQQIHNDLYFKLLPSTKMQKVFARFALHWGLDPMAFVFFFGSKRVASLETPSTLGMVDGEMIYATQCAAVEEEDDDDYDYYE